MKDFPVFTTDFGLASLILKEVPYRGVAFIHVREVQPGQFQPHLEECVSFCRMVGAERILAKGHEELHQYPLHRVTALGSKYRVSWGTCPHRECLFECHSPFAFFNSS